MDKTNVFVLAALTLVLGLALGFLYHVANPITVHDVVKENVSVPVEKIVYVNQTISVDKNDALLAQAKSEYLDEINDDDSYLVCDGEQYDLDQVTFKDIKNLEVSTDTSNRKDTLTTISFDQPLKFSDSSVESKCYRTDAVSVVLHSDTRKDAELTIS